MPTAVGEELVPIAELWRLLPPGVPAPCQTTVVRWARCGCRGVRLQALRVGNSWFVAPSAFERFLTELNAAGGLPG